MEYTEVSNALEQQVKVHSRPAGPHFARLQWAAGAMFIYVLRWRRYWNIQLLCEPRLIDQSLVL